MAGVPAAGSVSDGESSHERIAGGRFPAMLPLTLGSLPAVGQRPANAPAAAADGAAAQAEASDPVVVSTSGRATPDAGMAVSMQLTSDLVDRSQPAGSPGAAATDSTEGTSNHALAPLAAISAPSASAGAAEVSEGAAESTQAPPGDSPTPASPACSRIEIDFTDPEILAVEGARTTDLVAIHPSCRRYEVQLISSDPRHQAGYQPWQVEEDWSLEGFDAQGTSIVMTPPIGDLPEDRTELTRTVATLDLADVASVRGVHVGTGSGIHSVHARAVLIPLGDPPTDPTDDPVDAACPTVDPDRLAIRFDAALGGSTINLRETPLFDLAGTVDGREAGDVERIVLRTAGRDLVTVNAGLDGRWRVNTSAPGGHHVLVACASTSRGLTAGAVLEIDVVEPAASDVVVSPDVVVASDELMASASMIDADTITFTAKRAELALGRVLVAGIHPNTPGGLSRRLIGEEILATGEVRYRTEPAGFTDLFLQAVIDSSAVTATAADPAVAASAVSASPLPTAGVMEAAEAQPAEAAVNLSATETDTVGLVAVVGGCGGTSGPVATMSLTVLCAVRMQGRLTSTTSPPPSLPDIDLTGELRVNAGANLVGSIRPTFFYEIRTDWDWLVPRPRLVSAAVGFESSLDSSVDAAVTGAGRASKEFENIVPPRVFAPFPFVVLGVPVIVTPVLAFDAVVATEATASVAFNSRQHVDQRVSAVYDGAQWRDTSDRHESGDATPVGEIVTGTAEIKAQVVPRVSLLFDMVAGPEASLGIGARYKVQYPCPGRQDISGITTPTLRGSSIVGFVDDALEELTIPIVPTDYAFPLFADDAPGCLHIVTAALPAGRVGEPFSATLEADGGTRPYVWSVTGLPPGLSFDPSGAGDSISGTPEQAGRFPVTIAVADDTGVVDVLDLELVIDRPGDAADLVGRSHGDPHMLTFDRVRYGFQAAGEFIVVQSTSDDFEIQARHDFTSGTARASLISQVAVRTPAGQIVRFTRGATTVDDRPAVGMVSLDGGAVLDGSKLTLVDGTSVATGPRGPFLDVTITLAPERARQVVGLLGNANDVGADDIQSRDGSRVVPFEALRTSDGERQLYDEVGPSWVPGPDERILGGDPTPYAAPTSVRTDDFDVQARDAAVTRCTTAGWTDGNGLPECVFDLLVSGDPAAADASGQFDLPAGVVAAGNAAALPSLLPNPNRITTGTGAVLEIEIDSPSNRSTIAMDRPLVVSGRAGSGSGGATAKPSVVFVLDVSSSTGQSGVDCNADGVINAADNLNPTIDNRAGTILDCELAGLSALSSSLADLATEADVSLVLLASQSAVADLGPAPGVQSTTAPVADADGDGIRDIEAVLASVRPDGADRFTSIRLVDGTNFGRALDVVAAALEDRPQGQRAFVFFLSDGEGGSPASFSRSITALADDGVVVNTYSIGSNGAGCRPGSSLSAIATGTGGSCVDVADARTLRAALTAPTEGLTAVTVSIDGGAPVAAVVNPLGRWTAPLGPVGAGPHVIRATALADDGSATSAEIVVFGAG